MNESFRIQIKSSSLLKLSLPPWWRWSFCWIYISLYCNYFLLYVTLLGDSIFVIIICHWTVNSNCTDPTAQTQFCICSTQIKAWHLPVAPHKCLLNGGGGGVGGMNECPLKLKCKPIFAHQNPTHSLRYVSNSTSFMYMFLPLAPI